MNRLVFPDKLIRGQFFLHFIVAISFENPARLKGNAPPEMMPSPLACAPYSIFINKSNICMKFVDVGRFEPITMIGNETGYFLKSFVDISYIFSVHVLEMLCS